tara:strand:- start:2489 stop:2785 length:297 start_codon:yes stop_codon:yes gene_type:complete
MSFEQFLTNPRAHVVKKYMANLLQEEYPPNAEIIERLAACLLTEDDMKGFSQFVGAIYSKAYSKCVKDHQEKLQALGIETTIRPEDQPPDPNDRIFKD